MAQKKKTKAMVVSQEKLADGIYDLRLETELAQDAALRSISLTVRVTPPRGICQALLTDVAYELSVKSAAKRLQIFALRL